LIRIINSILLLYSWVVVAILTLFLLLIGRFYELQFGKRARYQLFVIPLVLFLVAAAWYGFFAGGTITDFVGIFWPDLLYLAGGLVLIVLCYSLHQTMMGGKR
jgi:hypothetical protein